LVDIKQKALSARKDKATTSLVGKRRRGCYGHKSHPSALTRKEGGSGKRARFFLANKKKGTRLLLTRVVAICMGGKGKKNKNFLMIGKSTKEKKGKRSPAATRAHKKKRRSPLAEREEKKKERLHL